MENHKNNPHKRQGQDKKIALQFIVKEVERGTGLSLSELKEKYSEELLFNLGLKHVTTTKKAFCTAFKIPIEAGCRYKRTLEKDGYLIQSIDKFLCPFTGHYANLISTNPKEFDKLLKTSNNQLNLFK